MARDNAQAERAYCQLARQRWQRGDNRVSLTTALRGRERAPKSVRQAARQAALQGSQSQAAASSSDRLEGLPWLPFEWAGFFPLPLRCGGLGSFPFPLPCHTFTYQTLIFCRFLI